MVPPRQITSVVFNIVAISGIFCRLDWANANTFEIPRGVPSSFSRKFEQSHLLGKFPCDEGESTSIPYSQVNDGYCDCSNGEDEPGTSACSKLAPSVRFYCINKGHRGKWIPSSRVDDGVCDCCDGSDEAFTVCTNSCEIESKEASEAAALRIRILENGARLKKEYIRQGTEDTESLGAQLQKVSSRLDEHRTKVLELQALENSLYEEEERVKRELRYESNMKVFRNFPTLNDLGLDELRHLFVEYARRVDRQGKQLMCLVTGNEDACSEEVESTLPEFGDSHFDEYGEDMYGEDMYGDEYGGNAYLDDYQDEYIKTEYAPLEELGDDNQEVNSFEDTEEGRTEEDSANEQLVTEINGDKVAEQLADDSDYLQGDDPIQYELPALVDVRKKLKTERKAIQEMEREKQELEDMTNIPPELIPLKGKCFKAKQHAYTYEMCPFGGATQTGEEGSTSLGEMGTYYGATRDEETKQSETGMLFTFSGGDYCYNGPLRSAVVEVLCGVEDELFEVDEPRTCEYTMKFRSPAGCDVSHASKLQLELLGDEETEAVEWT